ncbi:hypothetical protein N9H20_07620, partial [Planktomarina temperata]|nr:hypothetical protein [Planktomarina temperata]
MVHGWSGLIQADNKYVSLTILFYLLLHVGFCLLCFPITGLRWKKNFGVDNSTLPIVKVYLWLGITSTMLFSAITLKNHGTLGWFVPSEINIWQSMNILKIPITFIQIIAIHFIFNTKNR